jgi:hypothetical protein
VMAPRHHPGTGESAIQVDRLSVSRYGEVDKLSGCD